MNDKPLTACQKQMQDVMRKARSVLDSAPNPAKLISPEERESWEADVCLATRSAYFDFYTWVAIHGDIDEDARQDIDELFENSLSMMKERMNTEKDAEPGEFLESVQNRYEEFKAKYGRERDETTNWRTESSI